MSSSVLLPPGAKKKDITEVIQTLKDMAQDNSDFRKGLDKYSKCKTCEIGTHCEANIGAHVTKPEILMESMRSPWTLQGLHRD